MRTVFSAKLYLYCELSKRGEGEVRSQRSESIGAIGRGIVVGTHGTCNRCRESMLVSRHGL